MQFSTSVFPKLALILSGVGLLLGLAVSFLVGPVCESTATLRFTSDVMPAQQMNDRILQMQSDVLSRSSLASLMSGPLNLYLSERARKPLEDVIEDMRHDIHVAVAAAR